MLPDHSMKIFNSYRYQHTPDSIKTIFLNFIFLSFIYSFLQA